MMLLVQSPAADINTLNPLTPPIFGMVANPCVSYRFDFQYMLYDNVYLVFTTFSGASVSRIPQHVSMYA